LSLEPTGTPKLTRSFGLLQATALNMSNVVGVGPFITIPLMMATMGGPQAMLGWVLGAILAVCDGQVWSELGAAWPKSGGSYRYLREAYDPARFGRLIAFLFIWQFVLSGPLEIASGIIGFSHYATYLSPGMGPVTRKLLGASVGAIALLILYRRIAFLGKVTVTLWIGTLLTMGTIVVAGLPHFKPSLAFSFPSGAFSFNTGFFLGLGNAMLIAMYDYLGYYDVCYIGDEVRDPARVIPRSILYCVLATAFAYFTINTILIGVVPWWEAVRSEFIVSDFMQRLYGRGAATVVTLMILWTAFGSVFALLLGYSRVPYAAAIDGHFFRPFARVHPTKNFPHVSLMVVGLVAIVASFFTLEQVISALITTRLVVQFIAQIFAVQLMRRRLPEAERPYRMWFYPVPAAIAFFGWVFVFITAGWQYIAIGLLTLAVGVIVFFIRAKITETWPFPGNSPQATGTPS